MGKTLISAEATKTQMVKLTGKAVALHVKTDSGVDLTITLSYAAWAEHLERITRLSAGPG